MNRLLFSALFVLGTCGAVPADPRIQSATAGKILSGDSTVSANASCASAINLYRNALKANPKDAALHNGLAICYQKTMRLQDAIKEYKQAISLDGQYAEAWNNLGSVYHGQRKIKKAVEHYRRAAEIKPEMAIAHKNLGTALLSLGKMEEGLAAYRKAMELEPFIFEAPPPISFSTGGTDPALQYYYFAKLCASKGRVDAALAFLEKARLLGFHDFNKVRRDPDFKDVVGQAGFAAVAR